MQDIGLNIVIVQDIHVPIHDFDAADSLAKIRTEIINSGFLHERFIPLNPNRAIPGLFY